MKSTPTALSINLSEYEGIVGIAHARYATTSNKTDLIRDALPLIDSQTGLALVFNGHVQTTELRGRLEREGVQFQTNNDGELLLCYLAANMTRRWPKRPLDFDELFHLVLKPAVTNLMRQLKGRGAYAVVSMLGPHGLFAFRDPQGFRPLTFATDARSGPAHVFTSETTALKVLGEYATIRPLEAGELIYVAPDGTVHTAQLAQSAKAFCALESVYFAAADSILGGVEVYQMRRQLGAELARMFAHLGESVDVVVPVPDTAIPAAYELAFRWQKPIGGMAKAMPVRSFLEPTQSRREDAVNQKYRYFSSFLQNQRIALVDDSIVRGTTMRRVIEQLRQQRAKEVHVLVTFPPITHPCFYGIDLSDADQLLAAQQGGDIERIRQFINADSLSYLSETAIRDSLRSLGHLCMACVNGIYIDGKPTM
jgi:amidophosphoribosyltransferase